MNLNDIAINFYSFGFYGGLVLFENRNEPLIGIDGLVKLVEKYKMGGIEIPLDRFYPIDKINHAVDKISQIKSQSISVFIDLENTNVEYISVLLPYLPSLDINVIRIKMDQIGRTIYGGNRYLSENFKKSVVSFERDLLLLLPLLEKYNVSLAIENHQDFHGFELLNFSNSISKDLIGVTWDVGNSVSVLQSPDDFFNTTNDIIKNVHLKDYKVFRSKLGISLVRCPFGEGYVDYFDVMGKLKKKGVKNLSIELGAQIPRQCDVYHQEYWDEFSDIPIDKDSYLSYVDEIALDNDLNFQNLQHKMSEKQIIRNELNDIDVSVSNLKRILEVI